MGQISILLLDLGTAGQSGNRLRAILASCPDFNVHYQRLCIEAQTPISDHISVSHLISDCNPALSFLVLPPGGMNHSQSVFRLFKESLKDAFIIVATEAAEPNDIFELLELGADDFVSAPFQAIDILPRIWRLLNKGLWRETLTQRLKSKLEMKQIIGESPAFLAEIEKISLISKCDVSVLISGETGTGKEMVARAIHYSSLRAEKPFISLNCGAIPVDLMENELFGHERGAYTGASTMHQGLIHEADGGTLFLDEVDCLPLHAQVKLLRFLQEKEYKALGSNKICKADVRIIAASNADFDEAVHSGKVRKDLYYRLNVLPFKLPSLRDRQSDIPILAHYFLEKYAAEFKKPLKAFSPEALQLLMLYEWPGNVRELEHIIERAVILCSGKTIQAINIILPTKGATAPQISFQQMRNDVIAQFEMTYIQGLLVLHHGNVTKAARSAQQNRRTFWRMIQRYQIDVQSFRLNA